MLDGAAFNAPELDDEGDEPAEQQRAGKPHPEEFASEADYKVALCRWELQSYAEWTGHTPEAIERLTAEFKQKLESENAHGSR
jgi:hypothetical protein